MLLHHRHTLLLGDHICEQLTLLTAEVLAIPTTVYEPPSEHDIDRLTDFAESMEAARQLSRRTVHDLEYIPPSDDIDYGPDPCAEPGIYEDFDEELDGDIGGMDYDFDAAHDDGVDIDDIVAAATLRLEAASAERRLYELSSAAGRAHQFPYHFTGHDVRRMIRQTDRLAQSLLDYDPDLADTQVIAPLRSLRVALQEISTHLRPSAIGSDDLTRWRQQCQELLDGLVTELHGYQPQIFPGRPTLTDDPTLMLGPSEQGMIDGPAQVWLAPNNSWLCQINRDATDTHPTMLALTLVDQMLPARSLIVYLTPTDAMLFVRVLRNATLNHMTGQWDDEEISAPLEDTGTRMVYRSDTSEIIVAPALDHREVFNLTYMANENGTRTIEIIDLSYSHITTLRHLIERHLFHKNTPGDRPAPNYFT